MEFLYDHCKFNATEQNFIETSIELDKSGKLFNILTKLKDDGSPAYLQYCMRLFTNIYKETNSVEAIEKIAMLNEHKETVYNWDQMAVIAKGYMKHLAQECIDFYSQLNSKNEPIFAPEEMSAIYQGFRLGLTTKEVMIYAKLNENGKPIYNYLQMNSIRMGLVHGLTADKIKIFAQLDKDKNPIFCSSDMNQIEYFIRNADDKQILQLEESINSGLSFEEFSVFIATEKPAEYLRIYRSLYDLDCDINDVDYIVNHTDELSYDDLKKVKYILTCANNFKKLDKDICENPSFKSYNIVFSDIDDLDVLYDNFAFKICSLYCDSPFISISNVKTIKECLEKNIDPEQIHFLVSSGYDDEEMKIIANALIRGIDFNKIKELKENFVDISEIDELLMSFETDRDDGEVYIDV
jgi:hypothetical protein